MRGIKSKQNMKSSTIAFCLITVVVFSSFAQTKNETITKADQEVLALSKKKWVWMADKKADTLANLFHDKSVFVHMGGSWGKEQEINIIRSGGIHYKKADVHEASVNIIGNTAIVLNRITLLAVVGGNEVTNPFMVTEVYVKENRNWKLGSLSFTKLMTPGQ
jgi:high-affinity K+ transport system ATPase subunit B